MKHKKFLVTILLSLSFCFVSGIGYGEVEEWMYETPNPLIFYVLLEAKINYIVDDPGNFLDVVFDYDPSGGLRKFFPEGVDTKGKICVRAIDTRGVFADKYGTSLQGEFKKQLEGMSTFLESVATDMNSDIVAMFLNSDKIPLGYFYQGEYHLWKD